MSSREAIRHAILAQVAAGPVDLGVVVSAAEGAMGDDIRPLAAFLQEMARDGQVVLANDGKRWRVRLGPRGRASRVGG